MRHRLKFDPRVEYRKYMCVVCGYIYDEAEGDPLGGVAPGTRWEDIPITWSCPDCGAPKEDFEMVEL
ncbi:MAG: rubredoxin [Gammaproteobacteria bacterium]